VLKMAKNKQNKKLIDGLCVYLRADVEDIKKRLEESQIVRPLLKTKTVEELYNERKELYEFFADVVVDNYNMDTAIDEIIKRVK
jgi:shikimate kinase